MGHDSSAPSLRVLVLHNLDHQACPDAADVVSRADVERAAAGVAEALRARGHQATVEGVDGAQLLSRVQALAAAPPDLVFNLCESLGGDARHEVVLPSLLDLFGVPYTGSGPATLGLALRKDRTKDILRGRGIPTPEAITVNGVNGVDGVDGLAQIDLPFPLIVKPTREDASIGIHASSVVRDRRALADAVARVARELHQPALVERFIDGRELYVSLLGNRPPTCLPFHEIDFTDLPVGLPRIVSYAGKWDTDSAEFAGTRPTRCLLDDDIRRHVEACAREAFAALGVTDYGRVDVRLAADNTPFVIDVNPNCDLSDGAGFSRAASFGGLDYPSLIERVCLAAWERNRHERRDAARPDPAAFVTTPGSGDASPARAAGSPAPRGADRPGRALHLRGGGVRAGADRRRTR